MFPCRISLHGPCTPSIPMFKPYHEQYCSLIEELVFALLNYLQIKAKLARKWGNPEIPHQLRLETLTLHLTPFRFLRANLLNFVDRWVVFVSVDDVGH